MLAAVGNASGDHAGVQLVFLAHQDSVLHWYDPRLCLGVQLLSSIQAAGMAYGSQ
jgi:hypothetical protein